MATLVETLKPYLRIGFCAIFLPPCAYYVTKPFFGEPRAFIIGMITLQFAMVISSAAIIYIRMMITTNTVVAKMCNNLIAILAAAILVLFLAVLYSQGPYPGEYRGEFEVETLASQLSHMPASDRKNSSAYSRLRMIFSATKDPECRTDIVSKFNQLGLNDKAQIQSYVDKAGN